MLASALPEVQGRVMVCYHCGEPVKLRAAAWLMPAWTGPGLPQGPVAYHPACLAGVPLDGFDITWPSP